MFKKKMLNVLVATSVLIALGCYGCIAKKTQTKIKTKKEIESEVNAFKTSTALKDYVKNYLKERTGDNWNAPFFPTNEEYLKVIKTGRPSLPYLLDLINDNDYTVRYYSWMAITFIEKNICFNEGMILANDEKSVLQRKSCITTWKKMLWAEEEKK